MDGKTIILLSGAVVCVIYYGVIRIQLAKKSRWARSHRDDILSNWTRISVDLSTCSIKRNNYSQEVVIQTGDAAGLNAAFGREVDNVKVEDVYQTVLFCKTINLNDGKEYTYYSDVINRDQKTVEIYCSLHKTIDLYVNPLNSAEYYFDLQKLFD